MQALTRNFEEPDKTTRFPNGYQHVIDMNDGSTLDLEAGELCVIPSGHAAWVMGDDPCRLLDRGGKVPEHAAPVDQSMGGGR